MSKRVLIIGGVAGGANAAARLRRMDEEAEIIVFERGGHISYVSCGLPYFVGGVITKRNNLFLQTPASMHKRFNVDVRAMSEVIKIDPAKKEVEVKNLKTGEIYRENYDYLILSPGAKPFVPDIPGTKLVNVFTFRNVVDTALVKREIEQERPQSAVVIGGGFIGLEMAENLKKSGADVTLVEMANQVMAPLDPEMAAFIHQELDKNDVKLCLNEKVVAIEGDSKVRRVALASGARIPTDMVIMAIGIRPETTLAEKAGLAIGSTGAILVDETKKTSDPYIFAVGDAVQVNKFVGGSDSHIPLAGPVGGGYNASISSKYKGTQGTSIVQVFNLVAASTGLNEKTLKKQGIDYIASYTHPFSHVTYYPGATQIAMKLLFTPKEGKVLGAQIVGSKGVDKRIDVLATAIRAGLTVFDLTELELAYAPPFSSAKDPVNFAGYAGANIINGDMEIIHWHQISGLNPEDTVILDVRTPKEFDEGTVPRSINIPVGELRERLGEVPKDKEIIVFCRVGIRAYIASRILKQHGFARVKNLNGGWLTYQPSSTL